MKLAVFVTHPVQYFAPLFRALAELVDLTVYYAHRPTAAQQGVGFGVPFQWDTDLTSGYRHVWLRNVARDPGGASFSSCNTPDIRALLSANRPDAIIVSGWHSLAYWQAMYSAWRLRIPVMVRGDSQLNRNRRGVKALIKELSYPLFIRRFAACLGVGERSEAYFRHYGAHRIARAPHFVDNEAFARAATLEARRELRASAGIDADTFVVLFAGKLIPMKRPQDLVEAAARVKNRNVHVLFAGDGELRHEVNQLATSAGVRATFLGFMNQQELPRAYAAADVLVLPSDARETWGLGVNEAMATGKPAIVSDAVGCGPDLVKVDQTGLVYALGDVPALANAIQRLAGDRALTQRMGDAAKLHVAQFNARDTSLRITAATRDVVTERS